MGPSNPLPNCPTPTPGPLYLQISQLGGQQRRNWVESSELAHLPGRGVQISRFARNASLYRPGAARGWERGGGPGGRGGIEGEGPMPLPLQRPLQGPGSAASVPALGRTCGRVGSGARAGRERRGLQSSPQKPWGQVSHPSSPLWDSHRNSDSQRKRSSGQSLEGMLENGFAGSARCTDFNRFFPTEDVCLCVCGGV